MQKKKHKIETVIINNVNKSKSQKFNLPDFLRKNARRIASDVRIAECRKNAGRMPDVRIVECRKRGTSEERRRPGRTPRREKSGKKLEERGRSRGLAESVRDSEWYRIMENWKCIRVLG